MGDCALQSEASGLTPRVGCWFFRLDAFLSCGSSLWYGWWPNLVDSRVGWIHWIFSRFWILYGSFGDPEGSHWTGSTIAIQNPWFSAQKVEYGSSFDCFLCLFTFLEKWSWLPDTVFIVLSARVLPDLHFRGFRSEPKRCPTKSYADSWWYHLGKCLIWPFRAHLRFPIFGRFWNPLLFACFHFGSLVFTKFGHQPYVQWKPDEPNRHWNRYAWWNIQDS